MTVWQVRDPQAMHELGIRLGQSLRPGDVVVLHGPLGAGKTTLARGIGEGIGVEGAIQSPTFVVSREHRGKSGKGPTLVHVDAYRLGQVEELIDLDIDYDTCVTLIEWGRPFVEKVAREWLDIDIQRPTGGEDEDILGAEGAPRIVTLTACAVPGETPHRIAELLEELRDSRH